LGIQQSHNKLFSSRKDKEVSVLLVLTDGAPNDVNTAKNALSQYKSDYQSVVFLGFGHLQESTLQVLASSAGGAYEKFRDVHDIDKFVDNYIAKNQEPIPLVIDQGSGIKLNISGKIISLEVKLELTNTDYDKTTEREAEVTVSDPRDKIAFIPHGKRLGELSLTEPSGIFLLKF